jgi:hypothetical protein
MSFVSAVAPAPESLEAARQTQSCQDFFKGSGQRALLFRALFRPASGEPYFAGQEKDPLKAGCGALKDTDRKTRCEQAQLVLRLGDFLHKVVCFNESDNKQRDVRQLVYLVEEELKAKATTGGGLYSGALKTLGANFSFDSLVDAILRGAKPQDATGPVNGIVAVVADLKAGNLNAPSPESENRAPTAELADGLRLVALSMRAHLRDREAFKGWRDQLESCFRSPGVLADPSSCAALNWFTSPTSPSVRQVQEKVLDLFAGLRLELFLQLERHLGPASLPATAQLAALVLEVIHTDAESAHDATTAAMAGRIVRVLHVLSELVNALADVPNARNPEQRRMLASVLNVTGDALRLGQDRDWFGVALLAQDSLDALKDQADVPREVTALLRFSRVLLSMFQAKSTKDAQEMFAAQLEALSSREERYPHFTIDVGALIGGRAGGRWLEVADGKYGKAGLAGLFAPFGVQLAGGPVGALFYPLDLGSYLVADGTGTPTASAAVRGGGVVYARIWQYVPVVIGLGGDYRPPFGDERRQWRAFGLAALELPLFILH